MKGQANLDARYATRDGWVETNLYCPFCGERCNLDYGNSKKPTLGVTMKTGLTSGNHYRCSECQDEFILDVID